MDIKHVLFHSTVVMLAIVCACEIKAPRCNGFSVNMLFVIFVWNHNKLALNSL